MRISDWSSDVCSSDLKLRVVGFNYKDDRTDALRWLGQFGDPYPVIVADVDGRSAIEWGIYGAPESFLVDGNGIVLYKRIGALTQDVVDHEKIGRAHV